MVSFQQELTSQKSFGSELGATRSDASLSRYSKLTNARHEAIAPSWRNDFVKCLRVLAESTIWSAFTSMLTVYALFGDDIRLTFTAKPSDVVFDGITSVALVVFSIEIIVFSIGKTDYLGSFYFWLDLISTSTLILDIQTISEALFGDRISHGDMSRSNGQNEQQADTAANLSKIGVKATRVVRLMRLLRFLKLFKLFFMALSSKKDLAEAMNFDFDDDFAGGSQSSVSKKLTEMTTRKVILLILIIMLALPFFQSDLYLDNLDTSAQYGANLIYRAWCDGITNDWNGVNTSDYLLSLSRQRYEDELVGYAYFHNWFCTAEEVPTSASMSAADTEARFFYFGYLGGRSNVSDLVMPRFKERSFDWDMRWQGVGQKLYLGSLPPEAQAALQRRPEQLSTCLNGQVLGVSLVDFRDPILDCPRSIRYNERVVLFPEMRTESECEGVNFLFAFDRRVNSRFEAMLNALQTVFICVLLALGAMTFSRDANELVLKPIDLITNRMNKIRSNPLKEMQLIDAVDQSNEMYKLKSNATGWNAETGRSGLFQSMGVKRTPTIQQRIKKALGRVLSMIGFHRVEEQRAPDDSGENTREPMETVILEKTVLKIGSLLSISFGEVGAMIIARNMNGETSQHLKYLVAGQVSEVAFGCCGIRHFLDSCEVLRGKVIVLVNSVAAVVHNLCDEFNGAPIQTFGGSFLLVWVLPELEYKRQRLADLAIFCLAKITERIAKAPLFDQFRHYPQLLKRLPKYHVCVDSGLHIGWAVEGAVGSDFKLDVAYIGTHVNTATKLQTLCKSYRCSVLASEMHCKAMSVSMQEFLRWVDCIVCPGSLGELTTPMKLYSLDLDTQISVDPSSPPIIPPTRALKIRATVERSKAKAKMMLERYSPAHALEADPGVSAMRWKYSQEFFTKYEIGLVNYRSGLWTAAKPLLEETRLYVKPQDGPSIVLLEFMSQTQFKAPEGWAGFHVLPDRPRVDEGEEAVGVGFRRQLLEQEAARQRRPHEDPVPMLPIVLKASEKFRSLLKRSLSKKRSFA